MKLKFILYLLLSLIFLKNSYCDNCITFQPQNQSTCVNSTIVFTLIATDSSAYQWQYFNGSWIDLINDTTIYLGVTNDSLIINNVDFSFNNNKYRCIVNDTNALCSDTSNEVTLIVNPLYNLTANVVICQGDSMFLGGAYQNIAGDYTDTYTSISGCDSTVVTTLIVNPTTVGGTVSDSTTICHGSTTGTLTLTGQIGTVQNWQKKLNTGAWTDTVNTNTTFNEVPTSAGTWYYRAVVKSGVCNIAYSDSATIIVNPTTVGGSVSGSATICQGSSTGTLTLTGQLGLVQKWQKKLNSGVWTDTVNTNTTFNEIPTSAGTWYYRAVVKSGICNIAYSDSATIIVNPTTVGGSVSGSSTICQGSSTGTLTLSGKIGIVQNWQKKLNTGAWTDTVNTNTTFNEVPTSAGNWYYRAVVKSGVCNIAYSDSATVIVNPITLSGAVSGSTTICQGSSSGTLTLTGQIGTVQKWQKNLNLGIWTDIVNTNTTFDEIPTSTGTWYYRAVVKSGVCDIAYSDSTIVNVNIDPYITSQPVDVIICAEGSSNFSVTANGGISLSYQWQYNNGAWNNVSNGTPSGTIYSNQNTETMTVSGITVAGNHQYRCIVSSTGNDCNSAMSNVVLLTVKPLPLVTNNPFSQTICSGANTEFVFLTSDLPETSINWYVTSVSNGITGFSNNLQNPNSIIPIQTLTNSSNVSGYVNYTITTIADGCNGHDTNYVITVNPLPLVNAGSDISICEGSDTMLNASGGVFYSWYPITALNNSNVYNPSANPQITTDYTVNVTDSNGCVNSDNVLITVNSLPIVNAGTNDAILCKGESTNLFASGGDYYSWFPQSGLNFSYISNPTATPLNTTTYFVTATNTNNCINSDSIKIIVNPLPIANAGNNKEICFGDSTQLIASGGVSYLWNTNDTSSIINIIPLITTTYFVTVYNAYSCSNVDNVTVNVNSLPVANAGTDVSICKGDSTFLNAIGGTSYLWFPSTDLSNSNISNPIASPLNTTIYYLTVTDANSCSDSDSITISVFSNPNPKIIGDTLVCKNEFWSEYSIQKTSNSLEWFVTSGQIMTGQGINSIKIHWFDNASLGNVSVTEHLWNSPYCLNSDTLMISFSNSLAPDPATIIAKSNDISTKILLCQNCSFTNYQWGYENRNNLIEISTCSNDSWCLYNSIDTTHYYYWVKVSNNSNCFTKSYFNTPPVIYGVENIELNNIFLLYPNPNNGNFIIEFTNHERENLSIKINSILGEEIRSFNFLKETESFKENINLGKLTNGIYFIEVSSKSFKSLKKFSVIK